jgi:hypothetical protein
MAPLVEVTVVGVVFGSVPSGATRIARTVWSLSRHATIAPEPSLAATTCAIAVDAVATRMPPEASRTPFARVKRIRRSSVALLARIDDEVAAHRARRAPASLWGARRVPASGPITDAPATIQSSFGFGSCRSGIAGPAHFAPALDDASFLSTWRVVYACAGSIIAETLVGGGNFFDFPPPGNTSSGPAPIVRGASDVAAVWRNVAVVTVSPPNVFTSLAASFVAPGAPQMIQLAPLLPTLPPALAAVGTRCLRRGRHSGRRGEGSRA